MKQLLATIILTAVYSIAQAQNNYTVKGRVDRLSKANTLLINGTTSMRVPIAADGSFEFSGRIDESGLVFVSTDSSSSDIFRLEPGNYTIRFKEVTLTNVKGYFLRTPEFHGPKDAELRHGFDQGRYFIGGETKEVRLQRHKDYCMYYLDSMFKHFPDCKELPDMIRLSHMYIGDDATAVYQSMLTNALKSDSSNKQLDYYFQRKAKMEKEKLFENFSMKDTKGNQFQLSSVKNKKLILIDFWSSDCFPCRKKHEKLAELYKKYAIRGLEIVSVSLDNDKADWLKAVEKDQMTWINVAELNGWQTSLAVNFFVHMLPYSLWIDGERTIIGADLTDREIEERLK
jgi:thiol-disulfide isomerase/thioredoxin